MKVLCDGYYGSESHAVRQQGFSTRYDYYGAILNSTVPYHAS